MPPRGPGEAVVVGLLALTAAGTACYWALFFWGGGAVHAGDDAVYLAFERAFPAADGWMAAAAAAAAVGLSRRLSWAVPAGIATGSALVFLGLMDVLFDVEQGIYRRPTAATAVEAAINVFCLAVGPFLIAWFWRHHDRPAQSRR